MMILATLHGDSLRVTGSSTEAAQCHDTSRFISYTNQRDAVSLASGQCKDSRAIALRGSVPKLSPAEDEQPVSQLRAGAILPPCCTPSKVAARARKIHTAGVGSPRLFESAKRRFAGDDCGREGSGAVS